MSVPNRLELVENLRDSIVDSGFIMLSKHIDFKFVQSALEFGAQDYLLKPITGERRMSSKKAVLYPRCSAHR